MKLVVSDYDGTLKSNVKNLKINIEMIKKFMSDGNIFCIATDRSYKYIKYEINLYNIPYDYLICNNGLTIFDNEDNILYWKKINIDDILFFLKLAKVDKSNYSLHNIYGEISSNDIIYIKIFNLDFSKLRIIKNDVDNWFDDIVAYRDFKQIYLEGKTNKAIGINNLIKFENLSIDVNNIYTIGNNINDLEMLQDFNGYKMFFSNPSLCGKNIKTCSEVHKLLNKIMR